MYCHCTSCILSVLFACVNILCISFALTQQQSGKGAVSAPFSRCTDSHSFYEEVYYDCMSHRLLTILGIVLVLFPFIAVYAAWKSWLAFGIGAIILLCVFCEAVRGGNVKK